MAENNEAVVKEERNGAGDRIFVAMLIFCFALTAAIVVISFVNSPKFDEPEYIEDETNIALDEAAAVSASEAAQASDAQFPININSATYDELQLIPGVGPATAEMIVDYRDEYGTIVEFDDLLAVSGIGAKTVELLEEYCVIN